MHKNQAFKALKNGDKFVKICVDKNETGRYNSIYREYNLLYISYLGGRIQYMKYKELSVESR